MVNIISSVIAEYPFLFHVIKISKPFLYLWSFLLSELKTEPECKANEYKTKNKMCIHSIPLCIAVLKKDHIMHKF